jgi:hypothetical protein
MYGTRIFSGLILACLLFPLGLWAQDANEIVHRADAKYNGEKSAYSEMTMTIVRPKYKRSVEFRNWAVTGSDVLTLVTAPAREKGQSFLKSGNNLWSWNPTIQRLIKLPPSMMSQGWMGSDYTNDDILKESSMVKDYSHRFIKTEMQGGLKCYKIEMVPLPQASVVWGKMMIWISCDEYFEMKCEFYDEDGNLVKTHLASMIATFDDRMLPSVMEIIPADEPGNKTLVRISRMKFNIAIDSNFFTQQNMKRVK